LYIRSGKRYIPAPPDILLKRLQKWAVESFRPGAPILAAPHLVEAFVLAKLVPRDHEVFAFIALDSVFRLIDYVELFRGNAIGAQVHVGEVAKAALRLGAVRVIL